MAVEKKPKARRSVSKARLLKELRLVTKEYNLGMDQPIGALDDAIEKSIVAEQMANL
jgi:hypothetical protein